LRKCTGPGSGNCPVNGNSPSNWNCVDSLCFRKSTECESHNALPCVAPVGNALVKGQCKGAPSPFVCIICNAGTPCPNNLFCDDGQCVPKCDPEDCPFDCNTTTNECNPPPPPPSCATVDECDEILEDPANHVFQPCFCLGTPKVCKCSTCDKEAQTVADGKCPTGETCTTGGDGTNNCVPDTTTCNPYAKLDTCPVGEYCDKTKVCKEGCKTGEACTTDAGKEGKCNGNHVCVKKSSKKVGASCSTKKQNDCGSGKKCVATYGYKGHCHKVAGANKSCGKEYKFPTVCQKGYQCKKHKCKKNKKY